MENISLGSSRDIPAYLPIMNLKELLKDYTSFMKINLQYSKVTIISYRCLLKKFLSWIKHNPITSNDVRNFLDYFSSEYKSKNTYSNMLKVLKVFFREYLHSNILESFRFPSIPIIPKTVPTKKELRTFYNEIPTLKERALFLLYVTSGLRRKEILSLDITDIDLENRMFVPNNVHSGNTKKSWIGFFNEEAKEVLLEYLETINNNPKCKTKKKLFHFEYNELTKLWRVARDKTEIQITPQVLRDFFCCEMGELGIQDRYVDAFCGRTPKSVLAKHYTDYNPKKLKKIYDKANLRILA